jgi:hypothetical protein
MKSFTRTLFFLLALSTGHALHAQIWSDVGNQGFATNAVPPSGNNFAAVDMQGNTPYWVYSNTSVQTIVMRYVAGNWQTLPSIAPVGDTPHIAFDNSGVPYVVYQASGASNVKKFDGTNWVQIGSASINNTLGIGGGLLPRIVINPVTNEPYIVFVDAGNGINVARFNGTAWVLVGQQDFQTGNYPSMSFTTAGVPYVVSRNNSNGDLSVSKFDGANWVLVGTAGFARINASITSLALDATGTPHVLATTNSSGEKATVYKYNGSSWVVVGTQAFTPTMSFGQIKFNGAGVLHLAYSGTSAKVSVMRFDGTNWVAVGPAEFSSGTAFKPSLAFDASNTIYVGYPDGSFAFAGTVMKLCASSGAAINSTIPGSVCESGPVTLTGLGSTPTIKWYNSNLMQVATGSVFTTPSLTTTTTYQVAAYDVNGCSSARVQVVATVNQKPTITATVPGSRCGNGTVSLSATPSAGTISWFLAPTGGSSLGSGNTFTTPSISTTTTYYAESNVSGCISVARTAVVATIKEVPAVGTGIGTFRCGPGTLNISSSAFPTGATLTWFAAASGGSSLGTGNSFTTPSISTTTTYYAEANFDGCVSTSRTPIIAEVRLIPTVTSSAGGEVCNEGTISLSATTSTGSQPRWYDVQTGGTSLSSSNNFTTPLLTATKIYYVEALQNGCASTPRTAVAATIKPLPILSVSDVSRCDAGSVSFEAASDGTVSWFAASTGGGALGTGPNYTTPVISVTTPYFVQATLNGCTSLSRTQVQAVIITTPPKPTITQNNSNIEAPVLTSSASADNQWYKDGSLIGGATSVTYTVTDMGEYKVQVNNSGCLSPFSDPVFYIITGAELANDQLLKIYPNPATEELIITLSGFDVNHPVAVAIVDMLGRNMSQSTGKAGGEVKLNVRSLQAGQYVVVAQQGSRKIIKQFIKSN